MYIYRCTYIYYLYNVRTCIYIYTWQLVHGSALAHIYMYAYSWLPESTLWSGTSIMIKA